MPARFELLLAKPFPRFALISRMYNESSEQEKQEAWWRVQHRFPSIRRFQETLNLLAKKQESGQRGQEAELSNLAEAIFQLGRLKEVLDSSLPTARSTSDVNQDKDGTTLEQKPYGVLITSLLLRALAGILERLLESSIRARTQELPIGSRSLLLRGLNLNFRPCLRPFLSNQLGMRESNWSPRLSV